MFLPRDVVLTKRFENASRKLAILKQLQIKFKAKHGKGVGTPFPRVPAPLHPWFCLQLILHSFASS